MDKSYSMNHDACRKGATLGKWLIFERESAFLGRGVTLVLVNEPLLFCVIEGFE